MDESCMKIVHVFTRGRAPYTGLNGQSPLYGVEWAEPPIRG